MLAWLLADCLMPGRRAAIALEGWLPRDIWNRHPMKDRSGSVAGTDFGDFWVLRL
jgi:hypothetical protein